MSFGLVYFVVLGLGVVCKTLSRKCIEAILKICFGGLFVGMNEWFVTNMF